MGIVSTPRHVGVRHHAGLMWREYDDERLPGTRFAETVAAMHPFYVIRTVGGLVYHRWRLPDGLQRLAHDRVRPGRMPGRALHMQQPA